MAQTRDGKGRFAGGRSKGLTPAQLGHKNPGSKVAPKPKKAWAVPTSKPTKPTPSQRHGSGTGLSSAFRYKGR